MFTHRRKESHANNGFDDAIEPWQEKDDTFSNDDDIVPQVKVNGERDDQIHEQNESEEEELPVELLISQHVSEHLSELDRDHEADDETVEGDYQQENDEKLRPILGKFKDKSHKDVSRNILALQTLRNESNNDGEKKVVMIRV